MRNLNWSLRIVFWINLVFSILLLLSILSPHLEPQNAKFVSLLGLPYPVFAAINFVFVIWWLFKRKIHFILSLVTIIIGYQNIENLISLNTEKNSQHPSELKVMSFNVRYFNVYNWIDEPDVDQQIFALIKAENPDVITFQEYKHNVNDGDNITPLRDLGYVYFQTENRSAKRRDIWFGGAVTFSKYPIIHNEEVNLDPNYKTSRNQATAIVTDMLIKGDTVRIYNTHLKSLRFSKEDYEFVETITPQNEKEALRKSKGIAHKVLNASYIRSNQAKAIIAHSSQSPHPYIIAGDFNEPPYAHAYYQISEGISDSFKEKGFGIGATYTGIKTIPWLRIDFLLHSNEINCISYTSGPSNLSDHRPIIGEFSFSK